MAKLSDVVVDRSDLLLNVCASTGLVAMDKIQVQTPKGRCEKLQSVDPARRGRSNVSLIYLLQRPRVSPNYVRGALVKLSTKKNRFPHTFSKAPCSGMQLFRSSRGRVQPPLGEKMMDISAQLCMYIHTVLLSTVQHTPYSRLFIIYSVLCSNTQYSHTNHCDQELGNNGLPTP